MDRLFKNPHLWLKSALIGILLVGAFLRLYQLELKSLWVDEILQVIVARGGLGAVLANSLRFGAIGPPLDYIVTALVVGVGGTDVLLSEFILRFASVCWGILTIAATYALAVRLTRNRRTGILSAFLVALAPLLIRFSQEVRFYSLPVLLFVLMVYAYVRVRERPAAVRWLTFGLATLSAFLAHYYAVFVLVGLALAELAHRYSIARATPAPAGRHSMPLPRWLIPVALVCVIGAALLGWFMIAAVLQNVRLGAFRVPPLAEVIGEPVTSGHVGGALHLVAVRALGLAVLPLLAAVGVWRSVRERASWGILLACVVGAGVVGVVGADAVLTYFYTSRQLVFFVPFYVILIAAGLVACADALVGQRRALGILALAGALGMIAVPFALSLRAYYNWSKDDWRSAALLLARDARVDHIISTGSDRFAPLLTYYQPALAARFVPESKFAQGAVSVANVPRVWWVRQRNDKPAGLQGLERDGQWRSIRVDASPTVHLYYSGDASEAGLWCEVAAMLPPATVLVESELLNHLSSCDPVLAQSVLASGRDALDKRASPPLLAAQQTQLENALNAFR